MFTSSFVAVSPRPSLRVRWRQFLCVLVFLFPFQAISDQGDENNYKLLILGDSLSAAYGLTQAQGWVYLLQDAWEEEKQAVEVINAAISGDTTDGGLARLPRLLALHQPTHVYIELGGNDALQGHHPSKIKSNIAKMVALVREQEAQPLLQAMQIPTNYGRRYTQMFSSLYSKVSTELDVPLLPFFLQDIALTPELMQNDGIHPTAEAQPRIVAFMKPKLEAQLFTDLK